MANISKIQVHGEVYDIKDESAASADLIEVAGKQNSNDLALQVGTNQDGALNSPLCIAVGRYNLENNTGAKNIMVGFDSMANATGDRNTGIGYHAAFRMTSGHDCTHVGAESGDDGMSGANNTSVGAYSLQRNALGNNNTCIGYTALKGYPDAYDEAKKYDGNTIVGAKAAAKLVSGDYNLALGTDAMGSTPNGTGNTAVGTAALNTSTAVNNCVALGYGAGKQADGDGQFWVANSGSTDKDHALMYGIFRPANMGSQMLVINGQLYLPHLATSDPKVAGALWNDNGTLKISLGS